MWQHVTVAQAQHPIHNRLGLAAPLYQTAIGVRKLVLQPSPVQRTDIFRKLLSGLGASEHGG
jgi:hypothetical protein